MNCERRVKRFKETTGYVLTRWRRPCASAVALLLPATLVYGGEWQVSPLISVAETYTDNVDLAPGDERRDEFITELSPGLSVRGDGRRLDVALDYVMQNYVYGRESERNTTAHRLQLGSTTEFVRRHFFVDVNGSLTRQAISAEDGAFTNRLDSSNATDVATWSVSPYLIGRLGRRALAELRYQYSDIEYDDADALGGVTRKVSFNAMDSAHADAPSWRVSYSREDIDYDNDTEAKFESIEMVVGWPLAHNVQLLGTFGYEDNVFTQTESESDPEGSLWLVGLRWLPSENTLLEVEGGERYFGETYSALFTMTRSNLRWEVAYSEENISVLQQQLERSVFGEDARLLPSRLDFLELSDEVSFVRRAESVLSVDARRHDLAFEIYQELRESRLAGSEERLIGANVRDRWRVTSLSSVLTSLRSQRQKFLERSRVDEIYELSVGLRRDLGRHASASITYEHNRRSSNEDESDYEENALIGRWSARF